MNLLLLFVVLFVTRATAELAVEVPESPNEKLEELIPLVRGVVVVLEVMPSSDEVLVGDELSVKPVETEAEEDSVLEVRLSSTTVARRMSLVKSCERQEWAPGIFL